MKVSILMPVKNAEKWLSVTIKSILNQSYNDWELICIDDFSTDKSASIIDSLAKADSRIKVLKNLSQGIIPALQLGLKESSGELITRMDADDLMPADRLTKMVDVMEELPSKSIVTGKVKYFSEAESVSDGYIKYQNWLNELCELQNHYNHIYRECVVASPNWLARRIDLVEQSVFNNLEYPEDYSMCFLWQQQGFSIHALSDITLLWREHPERTSRNSDIYDQPSFFRLKLKWFCKKHLDQHISLLGAGAKGKIAAQLLLDSNKIIDWYDFKHDNYNSDLFNIRIQDYNDLKGNKLLIAIYPQELNELIMFLKAKGYEIGENAWFL